MRAALIRAAWASRWWRSPPVYCLILVFGLLLGLQAVATPELDAFETALDDYRVSEAQKRLVRIPDGAEKLLAQAELAMATGHAERTYRTTDQLRPADLAPQLRAKYYLIQAFQDSMENLGGRDDQRRKIGLVREGLRCDPAPRERAQLLLLQLSLSEGDESKSEAILKELFALSSSAGFEGRLGLLRRAKHYEEALALTQLLAQQAGVQGRVQVALEYRQQAAYLLLRLNNSQEAVDSLRQILEETLSSSDHERVPLVLVYLHWSLGAIDGKGLPLEVFEQTLSRLHPGEIVLETLSLALRRFPDFQDGFGGGVELALAMDEPLIAASFLLKWADIESDPSRAQEYRRQARDLVRGHDLRGIGATWYGYEIARSPFAVGLDNQDDQQIWARFSEMLASGRNDSDISEISSALLAGVPDRSMPWVWIQPFFQDLLDRSEGWDASQRANALVHVQRMLQRSWVVSEGAGQASTYAPRPHMMSAALGAHMVESPELVEEILAGLAAAEREDADSLRGGDKLATLAHLLASLGREQEALELFREVLELPAETELGRLRNIAQLARLEFALDDPLALTHLNQLAASDLTKDYSPYDQTWRRATELAWFYLDRDRPAEAERLARIALKMVPKGWTSADIRRLGAHEALAFALSDQERVADLEALLASWEGEQGVEGRVWLKVLKTDLLLRAGRPDEAAAMVPELREANDEPHRIYLADQRRKIALGLGRSDEVADMEGAITSAVESMVGDSPSLKRALLASPAYAEFSFLSRSPAPPSLGPVAGAPDRLEPILERLEVVRRREPDNQALARLSAVQIRQLAEAAGRDQVIVHPLLLSHSVLLLVASDGELMLWERFVDTTALRAAIERISGLAADPSTTLGRMDQDGDALTARLLEPWRSEFPGRRHLLWWATGELKQLPLALLRLDGRSILEQMTVTYLDGPLQASVAPFPKERSVLLIGGSGDLVGASRELDGVRALLPVAQIWKLGENFERLRQLVAGHQLVHIASHGLPPTASRVGGELSGSEGSLSAFRVADLRFAPGSLVVASACEVGLESATGPGDSTVLNALRTAGAAAVIGSPWPIDDQTSLELVLAFYRHLLKGGDPSLALAAAQLEIRRTHPHPFHWAGFRLLTGPPR